MENIENSIEYTEIEEVPLQHKTMAFWYKVYVNSDIFHLTILASNCTDATHVIATQFPGGTHNYLGCSEKIMQVNGTGVFDV